MTSLLMEDRFQSPVILSGVQQPFNLCTYLHQYRPELLPHHIRRLRDMCDLDVFKFRGNQCLVNLDVLHNFGHELVQQKPDDELGLDCQLIVAVIA